VDPAAAWTKLIEPWKGGDPSVLDEVVAPDLQYHMPPFEDQSLESLKQFAGGFAQAFPDFTIELDDTMVDGDRVVYLWHCEATLTGESPIVPVPPTGKRTDASGTIIGHVAGDKFDEIWHHGDWLSWLQKAGVIEGLG
jgi:predicted ester cyclase